MVKKTLIGVRSGAEVLTRGGEVAAKEPMQNLRIVKSIAVQATILSLLAGCTRFEAKPLSPERTADDASL